MSENDKNVPLIVCDFQMEWGKMDTLSFYKRGDAPDQVRTLSQVGTSSYIAYALF